MSLVYDALRRLDEERRIDGPPAAARPGTAVPARASTHRPAPRGAWLALLIAVPAAPAAFLIARGDAPAPAPRVAAAAPGVEAAGRPSPAPGNAGDAAAVASSVVSAAGEATGPAGARRDPPVSAAPAAPVVPVVAARANSPATPVTPAAATAVASGVVVAPSSPRPATVAATAAVDEAAGEATGQTIDDIRIKVSARDTGDRHEAEAAGVRQAIAELEAAQAREDREAVRGGLQRLGTMLPADSLTLLRMRAWVAHADGDLAEAERLYHAIAERVPNDRNAGINLALLQAGRGEVAQAQARLDRYALANGESPELARAQALIGKERR